MCRAVLFRSQCTSPADADEDDNDDVDVEFTSEDEQAMIANSLLSSMMNIYLILRTATQVFVVGDESQEMMSALNAEVELATTGLLEERERRVREGRTDGSALTEWRNSLSDQYFKFPSGGPTYWHNQFLMIRMMRLMMS